MGTAGALGNKVMNKSVNETFFSLLRSGLWDCVFDVPAEVDWEEVFKIAKKQTLTGIIADSFFKQGLSLGEEKDMKLLSTLTRIKRKNLQLNKELIDFTSFLEEHHIKYAVVKGQVVGSFYPNPSLRQAGDIDFFCVKDDYDRLLSLLEEFYHINTKKSTTIHIEFKLNDIQFEMHSNLMEFACKAHQTYWNQRLDEEMEHPAHVIINDNRVATLPPTINVLYVFCHLFHHLITSGIGIRQLNDLAILMDKLHDEIDFSQLKIDLMNLGLWKMFKAVGYILVHCIGLQPEKLGFDLDEKDCRWGEKILQNIFDMENFGHTERKVQKKGLLHSLETGWIATKQGCKFVPLAPKEILSTIPMMTRWFLHKL